MINVDRFVALMLLSFFAFYTYLSFNFDLLPFERLQPFKPNTTPHYIGIIGLVISFIVFLQSNGEVNKDNKGWKGYKWGQLLRVILFLSLYTYLIKPIGFIAATTLFLSFSSWALGERSYIKLPFISIISAIIIWLLVDKLLGIYLSPLPSFLN